MFLSALSVFIVLFVYLYIHHCSRPYPFFPIHCSLFRIFNCLGFLFELFFPSDELLVHCLNLQPEESEFSVRIYSFSLDFFQVLKRSKLAFIRLSFTSSIF